MSSPYRVAVIGTGKISRAHTRAYLDTPGVELVAAADPIAGARERYGTEFGVTNLYADPASMLQQEHPDIVSICTWPPTHAALTELVCEHHPKAIICEKPMAVSLGDADRMVTAAKRSGVQLVINHQRRFNARYVEAKRLLDAGTIGAVTQVVGICGGDALTDGTHLIDLVRFLLDDRPVRAVLGAIDMTRRGDVDPGGMGTIEFNEKRTRYGHHVETAATAILKFDKDLAAHLEIGQIARPGYQRVSIDGSDGRIDISGDRPEPGEPQLRYLTGSGGWVTPELVSHDHPMAASLSALLQVLSKGGEHTLRGESGRADLEVITAIYQSARTRRTVTLPLDCPASPLEEMIASGEVTVN